MNATITKLNNELTAIALKTVELEDKTLKNDRVGTQDIVNYKALKLEFAAKSDELVEAIEKFRVTKKTFWKNPFRKN